MEPTSLEREPTVTSHREKPACSHALFPAVRTRRGVCMDSPAWGHLCKLCLGPGAIAPAFSDHGTRGRVQLPQHPRLVHSARWASLAHALKAGRAGAPRLGAQHARLVTLPDAERRPRSRSLSGPSSSPPSGLRGLARPGPRPARRPPGARRGATHTAELAGPRRPARGPAGRMRRTGIDAATTAGTGRARVPEFVLPAKGLLKTTRGRDRTAPKGGSGRRSAESVKPGGPASPPGLLPDGGPRRKPRACRMRRRTPTRRPALALAVPLPTCGRHREARGNRRTVGPNSAPEPPHVPWLWVGLPNATAVMAPTLRRPRPLSAPRSSRRSPLGPHGEEPSTSGATSRAACRHGLPADTVQPRRAHRGEGTRRQAPRHARTGRRVTGGNAWRAAASPPRPPPGPGHPRP